jgi:hypothetical protein
MVERGRGESVGARGVGPAVPKCRITVPQWVVEALAGAA